MDFPRDYAIVANRAREIFYQEGWRGVGSRSAAFVRRRGAGLRGGRRDRLPHEPVRVWWPRSVVIVADAEPAQCYHYRVEQKVAAGRQLGVPVAVVSPHDPGAVCDAVQLASLVIVFRQALHPGVAAAFEAARRLGIPVVYEADDVFYRRELVAANPNLATLPRSLRRAVIRGADGYREAMVQADHVLASTAALAEDMGKIVAGRRFVMENGIDRTMIDAAEGARIDPAPPRREPDTVVIGYGSGSRAHDRDFEVAAAGLAEAMARESRARLHLMGPVRLPEALGPFADRVRRTEQMPYPEYLRQLAACDITIAPLADEPFNGFKSQVKVLEAAVVGVPLVASRTLYSDYVADERNGLLADVGGWGKALSRLLSDPEQRRALADAAATDNARMRVEREPRAQFAAMLAELCPLVQEGRPQDQEERR